MDEEERALIKGLLQELGHEERVVSEADKALQETRITFEVASQKYAAVRDVVARHLGRNPAKEKVYEEGMIRHLSGRYRFIHMTPGDAVVAALRESEEPMTLDEIVEVLRGGSFRGAFPRVVNATLMRTSGVEKMEDGGYRYVEPKEEEEELPFE